ncbi:hypothetical protein ACTMS2_04450 [Micromonospora sp. SD12]|uniref:hypothetical protein n=1 Tax=Micromonospora sp. SD12 TaxID=3452216 RepID=UPI003F8B2370
MNEEQIQDLLSALEELLRETGLEFLVDQERILAAEGITHSPNDTRRQSSRTAHTPPRTGEGITDYLTLSSITIDANPEVPQSGVGRRTPRPRFSNEDAVVTPLTTRQRLQLLLDLIEVATAGSVAIEQEIAIELSNIREVATHRDPAPSTRLSEDDRGDGGSLWIDTWSGRIEFADPPEAEVRGRVGEPWRLPSLEESQAAASRARAVVSLIDEIRAQAELSRSDWLMPGDRIARNDIWEPARRQHGTRG